MIDLHNNDKNRALKRDEVMATYKALISLNIDKEKTVHRLFDLYCNPTVSSKNRLVEGAWAEYRKQGGAL